jgi:hypothetical protein
MMTEAEWQMSQYVPTMEEYMKNGVVSFALGPIVLPTLYFVGQKVSGHVMKDQEHNELFRLMSTCGRLLNDIQGFEVLMIFVQKVCISADPIPTHIFKILDRCINILIVLILCYIILHTIIILKFQHEQIEIWITGPILISLGV